MPDDHSVRSVILIKILALVNHTAREENSEKLSLDYETYNNITDTACPVELFSLKTALVSN
jgi:hypothetical protein